MAKHPPAAPPDPIPRGDVIRRQRPPLQFFAIHSSEYAGDSFNPRISRGSRGGRFGPLRADPFAYLYLGEETPVAAAERLLRAGHRRARDARTLDVADLVGLSISCLSLVSSIELVGICDYNRLADWGADPWLVECDESEYPLTRRWAIRFRTHNARAVGLAWRSKRVNEWLGAARIPHALILFGDRCSDRRIRLKLDWTYDCLSPAGLGIMTAAFLRLGVVLEGALVG